MTTKAQSVAIRFLPSLTDVAFLVPLIFQFKQLGGAPSLLSDGDTGWHLRTGEWILAHGQVPQQDMFSYTHAGKPWFAWEWLWDVCFGFLNHQFGLGAVIAVSMFLICCTSALLYRLVLRRCPNPLIAIVVTALAAAGGSIHWLARPHLFTMLFTVIFLHVLDRVYVASVAGETEGADPEKTKKALRLLWILPALTLLWTNLHGGFIAGLLCIAAYAGGGIVGMVLEPSADKRQLILARVKPFVLCGILCGLATLVNPYFIGLHTHIVKYLLDPYLYNHITEFMPFNFQHPAARYVEALMLLSAATVFWNLYNRRFETVVLVAGWFHLGLNVRRNIPLFAIVCAPFVAEALVAWLQELQSLRTVEWIKSLGRRFEDTAAEMAKTDRLPRLHLVSAASMVLMAAILYAPQPPKDFRPSQDPKTFPVEAANMLVRDGDEHIFTSDSWGGYLIYRLYPKAKVFIDGRSDLYGAEFDLKYLEMVDVKYDWDQNLRHFGVQTVVLSADAPLASALKESRRWRVVYDDKVAIVFRLAASASKQVSTCPNQGVRESCGTSDAAVVSRETLNRDGSDLPRTNFVADISPPRLPLLNRP